MSKITLGSSFAGIDGFSEAATSLGIETKWTIEIDPWLHQRLKNKYPNAKHYTDIKKVNSPETVTIISAGFPCQDISQANGLGKDAPGIYGERSGLFFEQARITSRVRPEYLVLENSPTLLIRGMHEVITTLSNIGYMCEWTTIQGNFFGFPTKRRRLFIIAYPYSNRKQNTVFGQRKTYGLHAKWTPSQAFIRVSTSRANGHRDTESICRGPRVQFNDKWIHAFGNSVMPPVAEYIFRLILDHKNQSPL